MERRSEGLVRKTREMGRVIVRGTGHMERGREGIVRKTREMGRDIYISTIRALLAQLK